MRNLIINFIKESKYFYYELNSSFMNLNYNKKMILLKNL